MQEQFSYSLMASGLGILIVFLILVFLSILMIIIRKLFDDKPVKSVTKTTEAPSPAPVAQSAPSAVSALPLPVLVAAAAEGLGGSAGNAGWISAAVAAYFASEDTGSSGVRAKSWASGPGAYDPWVANNKLSKTVPGV